MSGPMWEDPPASQRGRRGWVPAFVAELRKHPGKWARVISPDGRETHGAGTRGNIKRAGCEVTGSQVGVEDGGWRLWARWPEVEP
jgi:hypothetical protein